MQSKLKKILWVDDEIEFLKPHILFLEEKGYSCDTSLNGDDAVSLCKKKKYDLILLDEMMPGMGGQKVIKKIKEFLPFISIIMVTKNEEESLMEEAIGQEISNYLIKPVSPRQVYISCKNTLESQSIKFNYNLQEYISSFQRLANNCNELNHIDEWERVISQFYLSKIKFDSSMQKDESINDIIKYSYKALNKEFSSFFLRNYKNWIDSERSQRPCLSTDIVDNYVIPSLNQKKNVTFIVMDCLSYDQFLAINELFENDQKFNIKSCLSILPSSTLFSRNSIFSGLFPQEIEKEVNDIYKEIFIHNKNLNNYEDVFLSRLIKLNNDEHTLFFKKINNYKEGIKLARSIGDYNKKNLISIVVNFIDMLVHSNSSPILDEIANNEKSYRSTISMWFKDSWLYEFIKINKELGRKIIITSDHGSVKVKNPVLIKGDSDTSTGLRYKEGRNIFVSDKKGFFIEDPLKFKLPKKSINSNYVIARDENFFLYPTKYNFYSKKYLNTFQHGGVSIKELFLPLAILDE